jgi:glycosyltransferase involved in cell wall biosynthesis
MRALLLEPDAGGRISGGYVYNARMAAGHPAIERVAIRPDHFEADLRAVELPGEAWLILDSLFLTRAHLAAFGRLSLGPGQRRAMLLHALPSFIRRAEDRDQLARALPLAPSAEELALLSELDLVIAPGPYVPRLLREHGASVETAICPPGVDPRPRRAGSSGGSRPVRLASIGSVTPLKGFLDAAEALGRLGGADFHWTVLGHLEVAPEHAAQLQRRTRELGLGARVEFAGQRGHAETLDELGRCDLLLITSYTENHPLVALEALAAGVPVVGYAVGGLPDIVRHGETGCLSPLLDIPSLSSQLSRLIADADERRRLAAACERAAAQLPSWSVAARGFAQALGLGG